MDSIRVVLVEDDELTRLSFKTALQQHKHLLYLGEAAEAAAGLRLLNEQQPDVAIVDIGLPGFDGIELTRRFRAMAGDTTTKILILTLNDSESAVMAAFAAGADSYCMKDTKLDLLVEAIEATQAGNAWIDPAIAQIVLAQAKSSQATPSEAPSENYALTEREMEVLQLIVDGCSNAEIAQRLYITVGTVKTHVRNILNKLCADDRTQAAVRALRSGLVG